MHLVLRLRGGGCSAEFADVSDSRAFRTHEWSSHAPKWRRVSPGLCLEGRCTNDGCQAYNEMVIVNMGYRRFDLLVDPVDGIKCPMCRKCVKPITCAFNNCWWKFTGIKVAKGTGGAKGTGTGGAKGTKKMVKRPWEKVGDHYRRCDEHTSGMATWERFLITVRPIENPGAGTRIKFDPDMTFCVICLEKMDSGSLLDCSHCFHTHCITNWLDISQHCPLCRHVKPRLTAYHLR